MRTLSKRISEHLRDNTTGNLDRHLGRLAVFKHGYKNVNISVRAWDHAHSKIRSEDIDKRLLRMEMEWIYDLHATRPPGINDHITVYTRV